MVTATKYLYRIDFVIRWKIVDNIVWLCLEYDNCDNIIYCDSSDGLDLVGIWL